MKSKQLLAVSIALAPMFGLVPVSAAAAEPTYDLTASDVLSDPGAFVVKSDASGKAYMLTALSRTLATEPRMEYLAVSPINPVQVAATASSKALFMNQARRPMTWGEAEGACKTYNAAGKNWRLPAAGDMMLLNSRLKFAETILEAKTEPATTIAGDFAEIQKSLPEQYRNFWMTDETPQKRAAGLKPAGFFGPKASFQSASMVKYHNVICITSFSAPNPALNQASGVGPSTKKGG